MTVIYAVVPSNGRAYLRGCVETLLPQVDHLLLVRNAEFTPPAHRKIIVLDCFSGLKLPIHEWWNCGIDFARGHSFGREHDVLVCNDDSLATAGVARRLSEQMRATTAVMASGPHPGSPHLGLQQGRPQDGHVLSVSGWFFLLRGEAGLRADTRYGWWYGDTDLEWQARERGGVLLLDDCRVPNLRPDGHVAIMAEECARDAVLFAEKWQVQL
jgi:hypothetical protein